jgi:hypothetical protein
MAVAHTVVREDTRLQNGPVDRGPFGLPWLPAVVLCELMYIFSRAGVQDYVQIDDHTYWFVGLAPFALQLIGERIFSLRTSRLVEVWMASLAVYLAFQIGDVAHFFEFPINLRLDIGLARNLATSFVYVGLALLALLSCATFSNDRKARALTYVIAAGTIIPVYALIVIQPF